MISKLRLKWRPTSKLLVIIGLILAIALVIALILLEIILYGTGFAGKTLWEWLQLLIIPLVLAAGGYLFTFTMSRNERKAADRHNQTEREIAQDNQCEAALQEYIDKMAELLLEKHLRESKPEDEVRKIARVRTLTVFPRLDSKRKGSALQFIYEAGLINKDQPILDLKGANLREAKLSGADLSNADLHEVDLSEADLFRANLIGANLSKAILYQARLNQADLSCADLLETVFLGAYLYQTTLSETDLTSADMYRSWMIETILEDAIVPMETLESVESLMGATMPDGSIHP